jgi:allantoin racemase
MTEAIAKTALQFANGDFEVDCYPTPNAPEFIETYEDQVRAASGMVQLVRQNEKGFDAFIVACHSDINLDVLKEITTKPVVGIGEASMKIASMIGHKFSVVSTHKHSVPNKEALVHKYFLWDYLASVKAPTNDMCDCGDEEKSIQAAKAAIEEDNAEVIVLGCAGMAGLDKKIQKKLGIPVLDGVICALIIATGLVRYGVSTSKIKRYNPTY